MSSDNGAVLCNGSPRDREVGRVRERSKNKTKRHGSHRNLIMTASTLSAASAALNLLLSNGTQASASPKLPRRRKKTKGRTTTTDTSLLAPDPAEEKRRVEAAVKELKRAKIRKEELEVRERVCWFLSPPSTRVGCKADETCSDTGHEGRGVGKEEGQEEEGCGGDGRRRRQRLRWSGADCVR